MFQPNLLKDRAIFLSGGGTGLGRSMRFISHRLAQKCS